MSTGHVLTYNITGTPSLLNTWFGTAQPGLVSDAAFYWNYPGEEVAAIAAAPAGAPNAGQFVVTDIGGMRAMVYTAGAALVARYMGHFCPCPMVDPNLPNLVTSGWMEYTVNLAGSDPVYGKPWYPPTSYPVYDWTPTDEFGSGANANFSDQSRHVKLSNGLEYLYYITLNGGSGGAYIYQLNTVSQGVGMKRSAIITQNNGQLVVETDTNGDGSVPDAGDTTTQCAGSYLPCYLWTVDRNGTIWITNMTLNGVTGVGKLPLSGFDGQNNPLYDWNNATIVLPLDTSPWQDRYSFVLYNPTYNCLYCLGDSIYSNVGLNYSGDVVDIHNLTTGQRSVITDPAILTGSAARDSAYMGLDPSGDFFYTVHDLAPNGPEFWMLTADGLRVASAQPADSSGWVDNNWSLSALVGSDGTHYLYAEDNFNGRCLRCAFASTTPGFVTRSSGNFNWTAPPNGDLLGWWKLDEDERRHRIRRVRQQQERHTGGRPLATDGGEVGRRPVVHRQQRHRRDAAELFNRRYL